MDQAGFRERLIDYQRNNSGRFYHSFQIVIGQHHYEYDIYWGDPTVIFDQMTLVNTSPLAVTLMPHRVGLPDTRIYLHEDLSPMDVPVFEMVVSHEIGHLWHHDIVGINNPSTPQTMNERDTERWCDYFAYCFFRKFRHIENVDEFSLIMKQASLVQIELYSIEKTPWNIERFSARANDFLEFCFLINILQADGDSVVLQLLSAIEVTLVALGDIFNPLMKVNHDQN